jgi:hypothetical protein
MNFPQVFLMLLRGLGLAVQMLLIFGLLTIAALAGAVVGLLVRLFCLPMELIAALKARRVR